MDRLFRSLKPIAPALLFAVVAAGVLANVPSARAEDAAGKIAEKFAGSDAQQSTSPMTDEERFRAEARKAVEQALEQQGGSTTDSAAEPATASDAVPAATDARKPVADAVAEEPAAAPTEAAAPVEPARETIATPTVAAPTDTAAEKPADPAVLNKEAEALSDRLKEVRREHEIEVQHPHATPSQDKQAEEPGLVSQVVSKIAAKAAGYISPLVEKNVTVLLVMEVGKTGVRRWSKTADPMLCIHESCYISRGADKPAEKLSREKAFGPTVALGSRGGACRSSPSCVFRGIDLETVEAKLQPIDLKFLHHDRREAKAIRADTTCAIIEGELSCRSPVEGKSWKAWIVPESIAKRIGAVGLEKALEKGIE